MDTSLMNIFVGLMVVIAIESLVLILIMWRTPSLVFLKASLTKSPLMYIIGKDRMGKFKTTAAKAWCKSLRIWYAQDSEDSFALFGSL